MGFNALRTYRQTESLIALITEAEGTMKGLLISTTLHGATSQKTVIFTFAAVRT
jgi:hypothetical protein